MDELIRERAILTTALDRCERGAFPGSRAWREQSTALAALVAFDAAHPEVIGEINRRHLAARLPDCLAARGLD